MTVMDIRIRCLERNATTWELVCRIGKQA